MLSALVIALTLSHPGPPPGAACKSAFGKTACGYGCVAAYGDVKCAQTPEGRCQVAYGEITCWDPERDRPEPYRAPRPPERGPWPPADCQSAFGKTACGYDCKAAFGELRCAKTPHGVCHAAFGKLVCWDPPRPLPGAAKARCEAAYGEIACGYGCLAAYGKIRCAQSPGGACKAAYGEVVCSE
jgi:hypothetical protein